jgi:hypothetical protein
MKKINKEKTKNYNQSLEKSSKKSGKHRRSSSINTTKSTEKRNRADCGFETTFYIRVLKSSSLFVKFLFHLNVKA